MHTIAVHVDEDLQAQVGPESLCQAALQTLRSQRVESGCELAVVVTGDETLRELNRRHRGVDAPTDVLAFANETRGPFVDAPDVPRYLGDVVVSFPRAVAQASEAGHAVQAELQLLVVHGVLHLLGYDDQTETARAKMWQAQSGVLQALGLDVAPPLMSHV
jgi:probable rRNA maturation factor